MELLISQGGGEAQRRRWNFYEAITILPVYGAMGFIMVINNISFSDEAIREICQRYGVRELSFFGSVLRTDFKPTSDVDLLVEFRPEAQVGFMTLLKMQREISLIMNRPVDLIPKGGLKPKIRSSVLANAQVFYEA